MQVLHPALSSPALQTVVGEQRSWRCLRITNRIARCDGPFRGSLTSELPRVHIILEEIGGRVFVSSDGQEYAAPARCTGAHLSVIPAGTPAWQHSTRITMFRELVLEFEPRKILEACHLPFDLSTVFAPRFMSPNPNLLRIAELMAAECEPGKPVDVLYGDSLSLALLIALSRRSRVSSPRDFRGGLAPWQLKRSLDYLESRLSENVTIKALADLARLSPSYYVRAFKTSIGTTPHRWLHDLRIRRVQQLLLDTRSPVGRIALETGFADQAHLTRVFRQVTGESPGAWRRMRQDPKPQLEEPEGSCSRAPALRENAHHLEGLNGSP
jgi:AraC family transcriptional regulator